VKDYYKKMHEMDSVILNVENKNFSLNLVSKRSEASVMFEIEENPNGIIKQWFVFTQLVIWGDVKASENAVFKFNEK
jgi:hypothetical protein